MCKNIIWMFGEPWTALQQWYKSESWNKHDFCYKLCPRFLNADPQSEKWNASVFGPAPPTGLNQCLHLSSGRSIIEWVDDCPTVVLWVIFEIYIRLFYGLISLGYSVETILKRSSHIFSDDKVSVKPGWFEQFNLKFPIHKFDHYWIQDGTMLEVIEKEAILFKEVAAEVESSKDFTGEQTKKAAKP